MELFGGIEAGGSKFVCALGSRSGEILAEATFATGAPNETMRAVLAFFRDRAQTQPLTAIGIGAFGPIDLNPRSEHYGSITSTPKAAWRYFDIVGAFRDALGVPIGFDTDVNATALGEWQWGAARELDTFLYVTVGTGVGGAAMVNGRLLHGMLHPEMGHIRIPHDRSLDPYAGCCPYHGDCLEGLVCGPALESRWGQPAASLSRDHQAWELETHYLGLAVANWVCCFAPQRIIIGGGIMRRRELLPQIRAHARALLNDYIQTPQLRDGLDDYLVSPMLGNRAGVLGAIALAIQTTT